MTTNHTLLSGVSTTVPQIPFPFKNKRQMILTPQDSLRRAVNSHIQLKNAQEPIAKRLPLNYNPPGWHNYRFYFPKNNAKVGKAWLMSRGHLVGYQFSGLNNEPRNLVPETVWLNSGKYSGMNDGNVQSMLYYENRLDSWLSEHPKYYLDYQVTPLYKGNDLIPRQVRLAYVGIDSKGQRLKISLGGGRETLGNGGATIVYLDNKTPSALINYTTGTAQNTVSR